MVLISILFKEMTMYDNFSILEDLAQKWSTMTLDELEHTQELLLLQMDVHESSPGILANLTRISDALSRYMQIRNKIEDENANNDS